MKPQDIINYDNDVDSPLPNLTTCMLILPP